jgi:hypothetical protein
VSADQGHIQLGDLVEQRLDALVFLYPCSDLMEEILGYVDGACFARLREADEVSHVQGAAVIAGARRLTTVFVYLGQIGGQYGTGWGELLQPAVPHPADLCRVIWYTHGGTPENSWVVILHIRNGPKNPRCEENFGWPTTLKCVTIDFLGTCDAEKVRQISYSSDLRTISAVREEYTFDLLQ